ncbi:MAG: hypothetical protein ACR2F6_04585 [Mycobacteriales bacterium]
MTSPDTALESARAKTGWRLVPLWTIARRVERRGHPNAQLLSVYRDHGVVRKADRDDNFNRASDDLSTYKFVQRGDLVLNKMKTWQGSLAVSTYDGIVSPAYYTCTLSKSVVPRYLHYLLRSPPYIALYGAASKGIRPNQWDLPYDEFHNLPVLVPPVQEQRRIADFLDDQVARIDKIISARQKQLMLIDEMLTSRLADLFLVGATVPMRRFVKEAVVGIVVQPAKYYVDDDDGVLTLRGTNVTEGRISTTDLVRISLLGQQLHPRSQLRTGDVVVVRTGDAGSSCVVPAWAIGWNCIDLVIVRVNATALPRYVEHALNAARRNTAIIAAASGSIQQHFGVGALLSLPVHWRDTREQRITIDAADEVRRDAADGSGLVTESVSRLGEVKRSLITAAVTGEFDVSSVARLRGSV